MKLHIAICGLITLGACSTQPSPIYPPEYYANSNLPGQVTPAVRSPAPVASTPQQAPAQSVPSAQQAVNDAQVNTNGQLTLPQREASVSKTNDFEVIQQMESRESDAERRARLASQLVVDQPVALPQHNYSVNPAAYALQTTNSVGQRITSRTGRSNPDSRACRKYPTNDAAQRAFLERGGPQNDPLKLDPDGDGFACGWDPAVYRSMAQSG